MDHDIKYIKKIEVSGLWGNINLEWNLNSDVNILAGVNGSGKTTLLDCICSLIVNGEIPDYYSEFINALKITFNNDKFIDYKLIKINDSIINIERKSKFDENYKELISVLKNKEGKNYRNIKEINATQHAVSFKNLGVSHDNLKDILKVDIISTFDNSVVKINNRIKESNESNHATDLDLEISKLQKKYLDYQLTISKIKDSLSKSSEDPVKTISLLNNLSQPHNKFIEIINQSFKSTNKIVNVDSNQLSFLIDNVEISPYRLSSGEKQLLIILLTILVENQKNYVVFLDEPEISLHIEWQKKLIDNIRELNPNAQLIISTHSPALIMDGWTDKVVEISDITG